VKVKKIMIRRARALASLLLTALFIASCSQPIGKTTQGTVAGTALGAGLGAIIGSATGHAGAGTAIGAGVGALSGAVVGGALEQEDRKNAELQGRIDRNQSSLDENQKLIEELRRRGADVHSSKRGVVVNLPDILFEFNKSRLTSEARSTIGEISHVLRDVKGRHIAVEGHTDSVGTVSYNKRLSDSRASSVAAELSSNGIPRSQMSVQGFGEGAPIATNSTEEGRARNRRVEVIVENR
jgi:outer membrane protein OmpA-like peptidoglycan-associated protein